ncbi:MAG: DUF192 domain-containing protein [Candidatus Omnitrophica bacterium]|nr:DUF192 domain-containing protein [Candidatus Omnitrophota bacterium]
MKITNQSKNSVIAEKAVLADSFLSRMVGLLKHRKLEQGEGLIITRCNSIHMFFMRFAIDVIFVDKKDVVVGIVKNILPNRLSKIYWKAVNAIEVPVGVIEVSKTEVGDQLILQ